MSDIVERLRNAAYVMFNSGYQTRTLAKQAADEIERLRASLASARREALEEAAKALDAWGDIYGDNAAKTVRNLMEKPE